MQKSKLRNFSIKSKSKLLFEAVENSHIFDILYFPPEADPPLVGKFEIVMLDRKAAAWKMGGKTKGAIPPDMCL